MPFSSSIAKQLLINNLSLPPEIINNIKDYAFHKIRKIPRTDERYKLLLTIPPKEFDPTDNSIFVYMTITDVKDYFMVYIYDKLGCRLELQTLVYLNNPFVWCMEAHRYCIK